MARSLGGAGMRRLSDPRGVPRQQVDALIQALHKKDALEELQVRLASLSE